MPRTPALLRRVLPLQQEHAWPAGADLQPAGGEDMVGWPELRAAGRRVARETAKTRRATRVAFISSAISLAITREDRLADVNINTSPSGLTSVP